MDSDWLKDIHFRTDLIGCKRYRISKDLWNRMLECDTDLKYLQNGMPDGRFVALVECHMKETPACVLMPAIGRSLEKLSKRRDKVQALIKRSRGN